MWIFGYGSLSWKVEFPYETRLVGHIKGYKRRFWQGSEDHRGIPGKPGRVVTLISSESPDDCVWGVAYKIASTDIDRVTNYLDFREKDGYQKLCVQFYPRDDRHDIEPFELFVYIGTETNPFFLGPATIESMAEQISQAEGPSGKNSDYVFRLAETMKSIAPEAVDQHLLEIEWAVKRLIKNVSPKN